MRYIAIFIFVSILAFSKLQAVNMDDFKARIGVETGMALTHEESKSISSVATFGVKYTLKHKFSLSTGLSVQTIYGEKLAYGDSPNTWSAPYLTLSNGALYKKKYFSLNTIFVKIQGTTEDIYNSITQYASISTGFNYTLSKKGYPTLDHTLALVKNFNKYENGYSGAYQSIIISNSFNLHYGLYKKLGADLGAVFINAFSYQGSISSTHVTYLSFGYPLTKKISLGLGVESYGSNIKYGEYDFKLYHRESSRIALSLGMSL